MAAAGGLDKAGQRKTS
jgi:hypothetical protein